MELPVKDVWELAPELAVEFAARDGWPVRSPRLGKTGQGLILTKIALVFSTRDAKYGRINASALAPPFLGPRLTSVTGEGHQGQLGSKL